MMNKNNKTFWKERQNFLKKYGYNRAVDGVPGTFTKEATREFQRDAKKKGHYLYNIDGNWLQYTEKAYQFMKPKTTTTTSTKTSTTSTITNTNPSSTVKRYSQNEIRKREKEIQKYVKKNNKLPSKQDFTNIITGKIDKLAKSEYMGLFESENVYWLANNYKYPNFVTLTTTANNPIVQVYQKTNVNCFPASASMALMMVFKHISQETIAKECNTQKMVYNSAGKIIGGGTSPSDAIAGMKKLGFKMEAIPRTKEAVQKAIEEGKAVIGHIETAGASCLGWNPNTAGSFGHYININRVIGDNYGCGDPTKGMKQCLASIINKATLGRDIKFYAISLI